MLLLLLQRVNDHVKFVLLETMIVLTVFREDMSARVVALFALLLFSKFFHTVAECRVEQVKSLLFLSSPLLPSPPVLLTGLTLFRNSHQCQRFICVRACVYVRVCMSVCVCLSVALRAG